MATSEMQGKLHQACAPALSLAGLDHVKQDSHHSARFQHTSHVNKGSGGHWLYKIIEVVVPKHHSEGQCKCSACSKTAQQAGSCSCQAGYSVATM